MKIHTDIRDKLKMILNKNKKDPDLIVIAGIISLILEDKTQDEIQQKKMMKNILKNLDDLSKIDSPLGLEALFLKGFCHFYGIGGDPDLKQAIDCLQEADKKGNPHASWILGNAFEDGEGVEEDPKQAVELYAKAAEKGVVSAYRLLGNCYLEGLFGKEKNRNQALGYFQRGVEQGDPKAITRLAYIYEMGQKGVIQDKKKAFELYSRAADLNDPYGTYCVALCYYEGIGIPVHQQKYCQFLIKAADLGYLAALKHLVDSLISGDKIGSVRDEVNISQYLEKTISLMQQNDENIPSDYWMRQGSFYFKNSDFDKALQIYKKAEDFLLKAQEAVGLDVEKAGFKTLEFYEKNKDFLPKAQVAIGWLYENGSTSKGKDVETALDYFRKAADRGDAKAKKELERLERGPSV